MALRHAPAACLVGTGAFLLAFPSLAQTLTLDLGEEGAAVTERALQPDRADHGPRARTPDPGDR